MNGATITDLVVLVHAESVQEVEILATSGEEALLRRLDDVIGEVHFRRGLLQLSAHVLATQENHKYDRKGAGALPRDREWRPYRFCIQDVIMATTVVRYQPDGNLIEVDVFLTAEIPELEPLAGARALARFLVGEAVAQGTDMEIRFTPNVEGGRVPVALEQLAAELGVTVGGVRRDLISHEEAVRFSLRLAGMSPDGEQRLRELGDSGVLAPDRVCYAVHEGSWSVEEVEVLLAAPHPDRILTDGSSAWQRLRRIEDLQYARAAAMCRHLLDALRQPRSPDTMPSDGVPTVREADQVEATEDAAIPLDVRVDRERLGVSVASKDLANTELEVTWTADQGIVRVPRLNVLLRPLGVFELPRALSADLQASVTWRTPGDSTTCAVLVPNDFRFLPAEEQNRLTDEARMLGTTLLVAPDRLADIDEDVRHRVRRTSTRLKA
jgi:hypothetical protein